MPISGHNLQPRESLWATEKGGRSHTDLSSFPELREQRRGGQGNLARPRQVESVKQSDRSKLQGKSLEIFTNFFSSLQLSTDQSMFMKNLFKTKETTKRGKTRPRKVIQNVLWTCM